MTLSLIGGEYMAVPEKIITEKHNDNHYKTVQIEIEKLIPYLPITISVQIVAVFSIDTQANTY